MIVFYWVVGIALVLLFATSAFNFVVYLGSGEHVPRERAVRFWRHTALLGLTSFDILLFKYVITTFISLVRS
jgi:hypothetical protein